MRSDWLGQRLSFDKLEGSGLLQLSLPQGKARFLEAELLLVGGDGSVVKLDAAHESAEAPVGQYSPLEFSAVVKDPRGGAPWAFSFGRSFDWAGTAAARGYAVQDKGRVAIAPLADLTLDAKLAKNGLEYRPGEAISVRPRLGTADRLTLHSCCRGATIGSSNRHPGAEIRLMTLSGKTLGTATSGFS